MAPLTKPLSKNGHEVLDLTQDSDATGSLSSEDEDLQRAIVLSLAESESSPSKPAAPKMEVPGVSVPKVTAASSGPGLSGFDRKQMEQERLARLKRKRDHDAVSPPPLTRRTRSPPAPSTRNDARSARKPAPPTASRKPPPRSTASTLPTPSSSNPARPPTTLKYPTGVIKRTWLENHPRTGDNDITLSELISAPTLQSALLSSYIWDLDWLLPHFNTKTTKFLFVMHANSPLHREQLMSDFEGIANVRLCFPPMDGIINCMHSKLMLLFHETHLRIAIPTANLMSFDWGEGGIMENTVFIIDLPKLKVNTDRSSSAPRPAPFYTSLITFLTAQTVPERILTKLSLFDFTATTTANIAFIHTIGGSHPPSSSLLNQTALPGLATALTNLKLTPPRYTTLSIDYVTSSIGSLTSSFLQSIYHAARGGDVLALDLAKREKEKGKQKDKGQGHIERFFHKRAANPIDDEAQDGTSGAAGTSNSTSISKSSPPSHVDENSSEWNTHFNIFFPSNTTVRASTAGVEGAGTICFQRRWWEDEARFPRGNMRDCVGRREGVLMHHKIMFVRYGAVEGRGRMELEAEGRKYAGWAYVGSANLSESAWGRVVVDRSVKKKDGGGGNMSLKLNCRNWECGVVVPVPAVAHGDGLDVFESTIPVPMQYPGKGYAGEMEPWFFGKEGLGV